MDLGGPVVDAERAQLAKHALDDRVAGHPEPAENLHATIGHAVKRFGDRDLGHARFLAAAPAGVENVGARSEEHTSELQSLMRISYAVFCLKKKKQTTTLTQ